MNIIFFNASKEDFESLKKIHHEAYRDIVIKQFGSWDEKLQDDFFKKTWDSKKHIIGKIDDKIICYYCIDKEGQDLFFSEIVVSPNYHNKGIGTKIIELEIDKAEKESKAIRLQVLNHNRAINLYKKLGFVEYGTKENYILMKWSR